MVGIDKDVPHHDILLYSSQTMFATARVYISTDYQFMSVLVSGAVHSSSVVCPADFDLEFQGFQNLRSTTGIYDLFFNLCLCVWLSIL